MSRSIQLVKKVDWSAIKYDVLEEMGETADVICSKYHVDERRIDWYRFDHRHHDGIGGFTRMLDTVDGIRSGPIPVLREPREPSLLRRLLPFVRYLRLSRDRGTRWKDHVDFDVTGPAPAMSVCVLTTEQTDVVRRCARDQKLSLTSILLKALDGAASAAFLDGDCQRILVLPTNIRVEGTRNQSGNFAAGTVVVVTDDSTPDEIHNAVRAFFKAKLHWGAWTFSNLPKYMGVKRYRRALQRKRNAAFAYMTNIGEWPLPGTVFPNDTPPDGSYVWMGSSICSRYIPIAAATGSWSDRHWITLRLHPSLKADAALTEQVMDAWLTQLYKLLRCARPKTLSILTVPNDAMNATNPIADA